MKKNTHANEDAVHELSLLQEEDCSANPAYPYRELADDALSSFQTIESDNKYIKDGKITGSRSEDRIRNNILMPLLFFILSIPLIAFGIIFSDFRLIVLGGILIALFLSKIIFRNYSLKKLRSGYVRYRVAKAIDIELEIIGSYKYNSYMIHVLFRAEGGKLRRGCSHNVFTGSEAADIAGESNLLIAYLPDENEEILIL